MDIERRFLPPKGYLGRFFNNLLVSIMEKLEPDKLYLERHIEKGGETPYDPQGMLGIFFYAYSRGVFSSRRIEHLCRHDVGFMFVGGHAQPDYSTICHFFKTKRHLMREIFTWVLYTAQEMGFLDRYGLVATDGTKILANASRDWSGTLEGFRKRRAKLATKIEALMAKHTQEESAEETTRLQKQVQALQKKELKISEFLKSASSILTAKGDEIAQNIVDPDCRIMKLPGGSGYDAAYNAQSSIAAESGLVVAADVTNEPNDYNQFLPLVDLVKEMAPEKLKSSVEEARFVNDCGYHTVENIIEADARGIDAYIPEKSERKQREENRDASTKPILFEDCSVTGDASHAILTCPGGRSLQQVRVKVKSGENYLCFSPPDRQGCLVCRYAQRCLGTKRARRKEFIVGERKFGCHDILQRHRAKMESLEGKQTYARRGPTIELQYGHLKFNLGFRSFLRRGLENVRGEWQLLCAGFNLRRMFTLSLTEGSEGL